MKIKKYLLTGLSFVLVAAVAIGGTLAYLTSQDSDVNVMTLGNVKIEQIEQQRDANGDLVDFKDGKPAYPAVGPVEWADEGVLVNDIEYKVFTDDLKNVVDKIVTVKNTGKSLAYVRTIVAIEAPDYDPNDLIHINHNNIGVKISAPVTAEIDGVEYVVFTFTYDEALEPDEISAPSLMQVFLDKNTTNEDCAKLGDTWEILVVSQAVQAAGFADAQTALDTAFGEITATEHPWSNTVLVESDNQEEIVKAIEAGKDVIVNTDIVQINNVADFDAQGAKVTLAGAGDDSYGYIAFLPEAGADAKVSDIEITGTGFVEVGHWGMGGGDYEVNNLAVKNLGSTLANGDKGFTLACGFCHYGNAVLNNCVMTGTTAVQDGAMPVDLGCVNDTTTVINGGEYGTIYCWSHSVVTIDGADIEALQVAPIKGTVTVKAGTKVDTINVAYGTSDGNVTKARLEKLVIEDGADVGAIVFRGNTYTIAEWNTLVENF